MKGAVKILTVVTDVDLWRNIYSEKISQDWEGLGYLVTLRPSAEGLHRHREPGYRGALGGCQKRAGLKHPLGLIDDTPQKAKAK